jgi:hypothetical protein
MKEILAGLREDAKSRGKEKGLKKKRKRRNRGKERGNEITGWRERKGGVSGHKYKVLFHHKSSCS